MKNKRFSGKRRDLYKETGEMPCNIREGIGKELDTAFWGFWEITMKKIECKWKVQKAFMMSGAAARTGKLKEKQKWKIYKWILGVL